MACMAGRGASREKRDMARLLRLILKLGALLAPVQARPVPVPVRVRPQDRRPR